MKTVEVEYIESGTFQGGEEDVFTAGIKYDETCIVLKKKDFTAMKSEIVELKKARLSLLKQIDELNQAAIDGGDAV